MATRMISKELKKIRLDYQEKMASLNAVKELAEKIEMARLKTLADKERERDLKKQTIEANNAINAILRGDGDSSNTSSGRSDTEPESGEESTIEQPEIPSIAKEDPLNSDNNAPSSSKRKEPPLAVIKRPNQQTEDGPHLAKIRKISILSPKRRQPTATTDDSDLMSLLNTIKRDNAEIMKRLDIIEDKLSTDPVANTSAETTHKGAFLALKCDWVPKIMRFLSLIYEEVRTSDEDK